MLGKPAFSTFPHHGLTVGCVHVWSGRAVAPACKAKLKAHQDECVLKVDMADKPWGAQFECLQTHLRAHGGRYPKTSCTDGAERKIGEWISRQRAARRGTASAGSGKLTKTHVALLEKLPGWAWDGELQAPARQQAKKGKSRSKGKGMVVGSNRQARAATKLKKVEKAPPLRKLPPGLASGGCSASGGGTKAKAKHKAKGKADAVRPRPRPRI